MGNTTSHTDTSSHTDITCHTDVAYYMIYYCQSCLESGQLKNSIDSFYINNLQQCQCNSCGYILNKSELYKFLDNTN